MMVVHAENFFQVYIYIQICTVVHVSSVITPV